MARVPRAVGASLVAASLLGPLLVAQPARAENSVAKFQLHFAAMNARLDDKELGVGSGVDEPEALQNKKVRFDGDGTMLGGGVRGGVMIDQTRFNLGVTIFGIAGSGLTYEPLPGNLSMTGGRLWGETIDLTLGREFEMGPVFPYIDLRFAVTIIALNTSLHEPRYGRLGTTPYNRVAVGLGPQVGLFVPMGDVMFLDVSGYAGLFGDERYGGTAGIGVWY